VQYARILIRLCLCQKRRHQQQSAIHKCASAEKMLDVIFAGEHCPDVTAPASWADSMPFSFNLLN